MFKSSVQWKIVAMFLLVVLSIIMVFGIIMKDKISDFYLSRFQQEISLAFSSELTEQLLEAEKKDSSLESLKTILNTYSGRIGINSNRSYYILDINNAKSLYNSDNSLDTIQKTENIISAMSGKTGNKVNSDAEFMDFAFPTKNYII